MSDTPHTDAACFSATCEKPESGDYELDVVPSDFARKLERRLAEWERLFETTNPAQAKAEHLAVLEKRTALQAQLADAHTKIRDMIADGYK